MNDYLDVNNFVDSLDSFDDFGVFGDIGNLDFESVGISTEEIKEEEDQG